MKRSTLLVLVVLAACTYEDDSSPFGLDTEGGEDTEGEVSPWPGDPPEDTGDDPEGDPPPQEGDCEYLRVFEEPGVVATLTPGDSVHEFMPLQPAEGFFCMKVEFDLVTVANLDAMAEAHDACPEYVALASIYGAQATGDYLATSFFRGMDAVDDDTCAAGPSRLEVGNYLHYTAGTEGPWQAGQRWHVSLEAKPWLTRIVVSDLDTGETLGEPVVAPLYPANIEDTRDTVVRLGQPAVTGHQFFPWFDARYENLTVDAVVAPPPEEE